MEDCIFCKIAKGEFIYEDSEVVVFKDINPIAPVHLLVVPKKHYSSLNDDIEPMLLSKLLLTVKKVTKQLGIDEYRTVINTGETAGQSVFHIHLHIVSSEKLGPIC